MWIQALVLQEWKPLGAHLKVHETLAQRWQLVGELYHKILKERKEASLPGSVSGPQDENQHFNKEDINAIANTQKINGVKGSYGKCKAPGAVAAGLGPYSFCSSLRAGFAFRGKSFKGSSQWQSGSG